MRRAIILSANGEYAKRYLRDVIPSASGLVIIVTSKDDMRRTAGLMADDTPWITLPSAWTAELRFCYKSLLQRFGPVWSERAFINRLLEASERLAQHKERSDARNISIRRSG